MLSWYFIFLQAPRFYKYYTFTCLNVFQNSRQTYALHLMSSLLNIFCYIISNVSIRKNLRRVQLMTGSYPDRQDYSEKQCLLRIQGTWHALPKSIWGNQVKIRRISQGRQNN